MGYPETTTIKVLFGLEKDGDIFNSFKLKHSSDRSVFPNLETMLVNQLRSTWMK